MTEFYTNWMEIFFIVLVFLGFIAALVAPSPFVSYLMISVSGMFAGRLMYERKGRIKLPFYVIIAGFFIGYLVGAYYGSRILIVIIFLCSSVFSYRMYEKGILRDIKF